jgi:D-3-phosphoglycerate dehydrogenase
MSSRIVLCYPVEARHIAQIQATAPQAEVVDAGQERIADEIMRADIFCGHAKVPVPWDEVVRQGRLRWIQSSAAGLDHCLVPSVIASPILVSSSSGLFADQVAEQTMCLLLALLRRLPDFLRAQQARRFERLPTDDLHGKTIGIVGFGGNGRRLAKVLSAFKVKLVATDVFPVQKPSYVRDLWGADGTERLLAVADIVILCVPLNSQTDGWFNSGLLRQMRPGSYLVNVARGSVVVEKDLVAALRDRHLAGAALDVTQQEPLSVESELWDMPQVVITPHVGAQSAGRVDVTTSFFCENLRRYAAGKPLFNLVDKQLGFPRPENHFVFSERLTADFSSAAPEDTKATAQDESHRDMS